MVIPPPTKKANSSERLSRSRGMCYNLKKPPTKEAL
jgi:hypothetical protein